MQNWPASKQPLKPLAVVQVANSRELCPEFDSSNLDWLSDSELARYQRITSSLRKRQFLAGHYLVRKMASRNFGNPLRDWTYYQDADQMRRLKCNVASQPALYVSISHSADWIAAAISHAPIGIDIETFGKQRDFIAIAGHVFSESETSLLKSLAADQLDRQFYLYWTLKESVAKQHGAGLKFEVSRAHSFITAAASEALIFSWQCPEYVLALAGALNSHIEAFGLCEGSKQQQWKNISVTP